MMKKSVLFNIVRNKVIIFFVLSFDVGRFKKIFDIVVNVVREYDVNRWKLSFV